MRIPALKFCIMALLSLGFYGSARAEESAECIGGLMQFGELRILADGKPLSGMVSVTSRKGKYLGTVQHTHFLTTSEDGKVTWRINITNRSPCTILVNWMAYREQHYGDESNPICCKELSLKSEPFLKIEPNKYYSGTRTVAPVPKGERVKVKVKVIP